MKDELGGGIMKEFVALRAKMYSYIDDRSELKKCKGINKVCDQTRNEIQRLQEMLVRRNKHL